MILKVTLLSLCLCVTFSSFSQSTNWKKSLKNADELYASGNFEEAANFYIEAYQQKNSHIPFLAKAAQTYAKARHYSKAADLFKELKDNKQYPLAGFKYAQALKQSGDYKAAIPAFKSFLVNYEGKDTNSYIKLVKNEVSGCEQALLHPSAPTSLIVEHLSEQVNSMANEFGPLPFNDNILYFSSSMDGFAKIFRSQFHGGVWTKAVLPTFPEFDQIHVCHGTFTPDNKRFYFTLCDEVTLNPVEAACDIYVTVLNDGAWSTPRKLRDYIKLEGSTATHPFVMHEGDMEILYFSSDRKGGFGGMDIWYMTRHIDSPEYDFTLPKNVGKQINTPGNEVTPYYDATEALLYFSSNGHATLGGYDVFQATGSMDKFSAAEHLTSPINSSADDYYYIKNSSKTGGFFASNRTFSNEKVSTSHDDIFSFSVPEQRLFAAGNIYEKSNNTIIADVQVLLYEITNNNKKRLLQSIVANNGTYQFIVMPERQFQIEAIKEGYEMATFNFDSYHLEGGKDLGRPIYLEQKVDNFAIQRDPVFKASNSTASIAKVIEAKPNVEDSDLFETSNTSSSINSSIDVTTYINSYYDGMEVTTSAPKMDGVYYKVQISTAGSFEESNPIFDQARTWGTIQTERIAAKNWTRIIIAEFYSLDEARRIMDLSRDNGFPQAFVVKYRNGKRLN